MFFLTGRMLARQQPLAEVSLFANKYPNSNSDHLSVAVKAFWTLICTFTTPPERLFAVIHNGPDWVCGIQAAPPAISGCGVL